MVITEDTAIEFFGHTDVEGETISLNGNRFQVVGVLSDSSSLENSAAAVSSEDEDSAQTTVLEGYIPYSTLTRIADNILDIPSFMFHLRMRIPWTERNGQWNRLC